MRVSLLPSPPFVPPLPLAMARGEGGYGRGFAAGGFAARRKTPLLIP